MDPNATLQELRELANSVIAAIDAMEEECELSDFTDDAGRMAELVLALDGWMRQGGFKPADWSR